MYKPTSYWRTSVEIKKISFKDNIASLFPGKNTEILKTQFWQQSEEWTYERAPSPERFWYLLFNYAQQNSANVHVSMICESEDNLFARI